MATSTEYAGPITESTPAVRVSSTTRGHGMMMTASIVTNAMLAPLLRVWGFAGTVIAEEKI